MPEHRFSAIGTTWNISTSTPLSTVTVAALQGLVGDFDRCYSRFRGDSLVATLMRRPGTVEFPDHAAPLFDFYRRLYEATEGAVSPLVGAAMEHLGYSADYSLRRRPGSATIPKWDDALVVEGTVVTTDRPVTLDFGAAGKGYLVDLISEQLELGGHDEFLVDASGDLAHRGRHACKIGLEDPADPERVIGVALLGNAAMCGSATNRRTWGEDLHHILDPASGEPTAGITAAWVVSATAMVADGLATAIFLTEPGRLAEYFSFSYVRMPVAGGLEYSLNFDGELFT